MDDIPNLKTKNIQISILEYYFFRISDCKLQITDYKLQITDYRLQIADYSAAQRTTIHYQLSIVN